MCRLESEVTFVRFLEKGIGSNQSLAVSSSLNFPLGARARTSHLMIGGENAAQHRPKDNKRLNQKRGQPTSPVLKKRRCCGGVYILPILPRIFDTPLIMLRPLLPSKPPPVHAALLLLSSCW